jgi:hypothetical protein
MRILIAFLLGLPAVNGRPTMPESQWSSLSPQAQAIHAQSQAINAMTTPRALAARKQQLV